MIKLIWGKRFKKNIKRYFSMHPEMESRIRSKLKVFVKNPYAPELRNHKLSGQLKGLRAIIVEYDCRIVFAFIGKDAALLIGVGTHDELY